MLNRKNLLIGTFIILIVISFLPSVSNVSENDNKPNLNKLPETSDVLKDSTNIQISYINREANISGYGLLSIRDTFTISNTNDYALDYALIGIPNSLSDLLVFYEARVGGETVTVERKYLEMDDYEMVLIYFSSPILPKSSITVDFIQVYKDSIIIGYDDYQYYNYSGMVYPIFPYKAQGDITATFNIPSTSTARQTDWGEASSDDNKKIVYGFEELEDLIDVSTIEPLATNLKGYETILLSSSDNSLTKLEILDLERVIELSPWGILDVKETYLMQNLGYVGITTISLEIPGPSKMVLVSDDLGELTGTSFSPAQNYTHLDYRTLTIDFSDNRVQITPNSKVKFTIEYHLIFEKYYSSNWFTESIQFDALLTKSEFLIRDLTTKIYLKGCFGINSITTQPNSVDYTLDSTIIVYEDTDITPKDKRELQFTFTINLFNMIFRPLIFIILIALISSIYVIIVKSRKREDLGIISREYVPSNEIREFCALFEEKNALYYEIKAAEENAKRKKLNKKQFRNIQTKNNSKINEINEEIKPFQEQLIEANPVFKKILNNLDVLEAERVSVEDSIKLLETRYKQGKISSVSAYKNLLDNFSRRRQKIDRNIDKLIQHLRSYLL